MKTKTENALKKSRGSATVGKRARKSPQAVRAHASARETGPMGRPTREQIEALAYFNFLNAGRPDGCHLQHWLDAETHLTLVIMDA